MSTAQQTPPELYFLVFSVLSVILSVGALVIAFGALQSSRNSVKASIFDRRFAVYSDVESYLASWMRNGEPDQELLSTLVGAWTRSHFLFEQDVTDYLRKVWTDGVEANYLCSIIKGEANGDYDVAVEKKYALLKFHADFEKLRAVFAHTLKVSHSK